MYSPELDKTTSWPKAQLTMPETIAFKARNIKIASDIASRVE